MIISFPICMNKKCDEVVINAIISLTYKPFNVCWGLIQRFRFLSLFFLSEVVLFILTIEHWYLSTIKEKKKQIKLDQTCKMRCSTFFFSELERLAGDAVDMSLGTWSCTIFLRIFIWRRNHCGVINEHTVFMRTLIRPQLLSSWNSDVHTMKFLF